MITKLITLGILIASYFISDKHPKTEAEKSKERGAIIYDDFCIMCHQTNGKGSRLIPPLANSDYLLTKRNASIKAIKFGQAGEIIVNGKKYNSSMATMGLSNEEVADVMNYILNSWGNKSNDIVTKEEVKKLKK